MVRDKSPLLEASEALQELRLNSAQRRQQKLEESAKEKAKIEDSIREAKENRMSKSKAFSEASSRIRTELLQDTLKSIYIGALMETTALTDNGLELANRLIENYVKENGTQTILRKMKGKTYIQDCIHNIVESTHMHVMQEVENDIDNKDASDISSTEVSDEEREQMYDDLSKEEDINKAVETIAQRVTDAEQEFIQKNNEDKEALKNIANKFTERIKGADLDSDGGSETPENNTDITSDSSPSVEEPEVDDTEETDDSGDVTETTPTENESEDDETKKEIKEEAARIAKQMMGDRRDKRIRNVYEQVVVNLTSSIIKDDTLKEQYLDENNKLDMGNIVEAATCIYTLMEFVNTLQLERVDSKYIEKALSTI